MSNTNTFQVLLGRCTGDYNMSLYRIRPLGYREYLIAFELYRGVALAVQSGGDVREEFTLWDPHGRPHQAYPETRIERAMSGRELMQLQREMWAQHAETTRRLFGSSPLTGSFRQDAPLRGLIAFSVAIWSERGRWTLAHRDGPRWYFTPAQLRDGLTRPVPSAGRSELAL